MREQNIFLQSLMHYVWCKPNVLFKNLKKWLSRKRNMAHLKYRIITRTNAHFEELGELYYSDGRKKLRCHSVSNRPVSYTHLDVYKRQDRQCWSVTTNIDTRHSDDGKQCRHPHQTKK